MLYRGAAGFSSVPCELGRWDENRDGRRELTDGDSRFAQQQVDDPGAANTLPGVIATPDLPSDFPIVDAQTWHTAELADVMGHESQVVDKGDRRDLQVIGPDGRALGF